MVSLLARLPRRGGAGQARRCRSAGSPWPPPSPSTSPGWRDSGLALVVVQTLDPAGGLGTGASVALAGRLWLLAQGGELDVGAGPLVLAPLLLTLGDRLGLSRAGRGLAAAARPDGRRGRRRGPPALVVAVHVLLTVVARARPRRPGRRGRPAPDRRGCRRPRRSSPSAGASAGSPACSTRRSTGCPAPPGRCCAACWPACSPRWRCARPSSPSRWPPTPTATRRCPAPSGGAAAGALGLLGLGVLLLPNAAAAVLGLAAGPGFSVGAGTLVSVHGVTLGAVPALPAAGRAARHPGRAADRLRVAGDPGARRPRRRRDGRSLVRRRGRRIGRRRADRAAGRRPARRRQRRPRLGRRRLARRRRAGRGRRARRWPRASRWPRRAGSPPRSRPPSPAGGRWAESGPSGAPG